MQPPRAAESATQSSPQETRTEERHHERVPYSDIVLITRQESSRTLAALGEDLTPAGVAISTDQQLSIGEKVSAWVRLTHAVGLIRCDAIVRYRLRWRHGLEFQDVTPEQAALLERICRAV